jgi:hypothetical protein
MACGIARTSNESLKVLTIPQDLVPHFMQLKYKATKFKRKERKVLIQSCSFVLEMVRLGNDRKQAFIDFKTLKGNIWKKYAIGGSTF